MMIQRVVVRLMAMALLAGPLVAQNAKATPASGFQVGDQISLQVEGDTLFTKTLTVGPGPALTLPVIGAIPLAGVQRAEVVVGRGNPQLLEKQVRHFRIVVLTRVHDDVLDVAPPGELSIHRRQLHEVGAGPDDRQDAH